MRIATPTFTNNLLTELDKLSRQQQRLQIQLSSQTRIHNAEDNPLGFANIVQTESRERSLVTYRENLNRAEYISELSQNYLGLLSRALNEAINVSNIENISLNDTGRMDANVQLLNNLIEQAIVALKAKSG